MLENWSIVFVNKHTHMGVVLEARANHFGSLALLARSGFWH